MMRPVDPSEAVRIEGLDDAALVDRAGQRDGAVFWLIIKRHNQRSTASPAPSWMMNRGGGRTPRGIYPRLGAGAALAGIPRPSPVLAQDISDEDIFRFALNLEYMEAEYYLRGTTEQGISAEDAGSGAGEVVGGHEVPFELDPIAGSLRNWPRMNSPMFATTVRHSEAMRWIGRPSISTPNSPP